MQKGPFIALKREIMLDLCCAYFRCTRKVDDIYFIRLQIIKFPFPIITYHKNIHLIICYILYFLFQTILWNHQIHIAQCFQ